MDLWRGVSVRRESAGVLGIQHGALGFGKDFFERVEMPLEFGGY